MRFPNRTGFAKKGEKLHNFLKLNGSADRTTRLKPLSSNGWSPPSPAEDDMNKRRHAGTLPNRFLVVVRKWRIASDKKSAETPQQSAEIPKQKHPKQKHSLLQKKLHVGRMLGSIRERCVGCKQSKYIGRCSILE